MCIPIFVSYIGRSRDTKSLRFNVRTVHGIDGRLFKVNVLVNIIRRFKNCYKTNIKGEI